MNKGQIANLARLSIQLEEVRDVLEEFAHVPERFDYQTRVNADALNTAVEKLNSAIYLIALVEAQT